MFTPTLTGLGERSHLLTRQVDLNTHIQDVVAVLDYEDLNEVTLVGHSYGGMVITGVADRVPDRLARLVYLDGAVPLEGQSLLQATASGARNSALETGDTGGDGWRLAPRSLSYMGVTDIEDVQWMGAKLGDHPFATINQSLQFDSSIVQTIPRTYIRCTEGSPNFVKTAARLKADNDWQYIEIESGHDAMVTAPQELAGMLLRLT